MSVKYPNYVNLTSSSEEQPNERTPSPPPRKKSLSPPQAPSKSFSSKSTHYNSSSSPSESPTPTHVAPPPKLRFPPGISNPSPPPRVSRPPPGFPNPPPGFEPLPLTQPLFININNNTHLLNNSAPPLENIHHPPPNLGNQDFPNPPNILDFFHSNDMPHHHNMFCQSCSTTRHEIQMLRNRVNYIFNIVASSSAPWIYLGQFWHTLKDDGSKYRLSFVLYRKELTMTLDDFRIIFQLPQATNNNHERFVAAPKFSEMVLFFLNDLVTGYDQPLLQIMQMLYCFVNNVHVDYANLLSEGLHYSLEHPSTLIPYLRFIKLIVSHYMTPYPEISRRVRNKYHNLEHDEMVKTIFNSGKNKSRVGMKIPRWMITDEMKLTENYRMYAEVLRMKENQVLNKSLLLLDFIFHQDGRLDSTPILTAAKVEEMIVQDTIQTSIAEQKSHDDLEAKQNEEKVKEHLIAKEIEKMVEGTENVENDEVVNYVLNNQNDPNTRLDPGSYKESLEVEKTDVKQPVNVIEVEGDYELRRRVKGKNVEESRHTPSSTPIRSPRTHSTLVSLDTKKLQVLTVTDSKSLSSTPSSSLPKPTLSMSQHILSLFKPKTGRFKRYKRFFDELQRRYSYLFGHLKTRFLARKKFNVLAQHLQEVMEESLPNMVDDRVKELTKTQVPLYVAEGLIIEIKQNQADVAKMITNAIKEECENLRVDSSVKNYMSVHILHVHPTQASQASAQEQSSTIRPRDQDDPYDDAHPERENSEKSEPGPSTSGNQEQLDDFDFWTDTYATDDDKLPTEKVSQELVEEMSETVDEAKLRKVIDEMLRQ
ncbi:hypothetical protein Tco_0890441 [Tanacetum coccineum]|uniref:Uncharacterized protein n=1 Tax=Tanacetum coccineum TaxID=301880 RepID=A0ABQ5C5I8_9ASTR